MATPALSVFSLYDVGGPSPVQSDHKGCVRAVAGGQVVVAPLFDDPAVVEDDDAVGRDRLGEAVGHDEGCASADQSVDGRFKHPRPGGACFGGGFVKDDDRGCCQVEAGEGELLGLDGADLVTALTDDRVESVVEATDPVGTYVVQGGEEVGVGGIWSGEAEVLGDRAGKTWTSWLTSATAVRIPSEPSSSWVRVPIRIDP